MKDSKKKTALDEENITPRIRKRIGEICEDICSAFRSSPSEVARMLGIPLRDVNRLVSEGVIPSWKYDGEHVVLSPSSIQFKIREYCQVAGKQGMDVLVSWRSDLEPVGGLCIKPDGTIYIPKSAIDSAWLKSQAIRRERAKKKS